jgi:hypothetical protein
MDAKYVKGMINNPDLQPNATINQWITGILLFNFRLVHIPATHHTGVDGLSRRPAAENDPPEDNDFEDWLDRAYSFSVSLHNDQLPPPGGIANSYRHLTSISPTPYLISVMVYTIPDSDQGDPMIPSLAKVLTKEAWIEEIRGFLDTRI